MVFGPQKDKTEIFPSVALCITLICLKLTDTVTNVFKKYLKLVNNGNGGLLKTIFFLIRFTGSAVIIYYEGIVFSCL